MTRGSHALYIPIKSLNVVNMYVAYCSQTTFDVNCHHFDMSTLKEYGIHYLHVAAVFQ